MVDNPSRITPHRVKKKPNSKPTAAKIVKKAPKARLIKLRMVLVWMFLVLGMGGLVSRLYQLQIVQSQKLQSQARSQQTVNLRPYIPRRSVVDSQLNILATDRLVYTIYAHPQLFDKNTTFAEIAQKIAPILGKSPQELIERFQKQSTGIQLAYSLEETKANQLKKLELGGGIDFVEHYDRFYPQNEMAADILGYVDREHQGQAGIEMSQRRILERDLFDISTKRTRDGLILPGYLPEKMFNFDDLQLQLTIDTRLQRAARNALKQQIKKFHAKRGCVIVMDSQDGSLLTLVTEPTFNPNEYYKSNIALFKNWSVADLYEPGSTFKPLNIAIALQEGVIQPNTIINDSGRIIVDSWPIANATHKAFGPMTIAEVLQNSSNVAMVQIMQRVNRKTYYQNLLKLELGKELGIDLPGEVAGHLKSEAEFTSKAIESATASFGQGLSLTPMKLVQLNGALANGGTLVTPHLVKGLVDDHGQLHWQPKHPTKTIFSAEITKKVIAMMETVVSEGTGGSAQIDRYRIAGKTGTAQKASPRGGYLANAKITSFVGILPVESPRYVILAVVDEPQGANTYGSTVAAPVVKSVMEALISIKGIPPSQVAPTNKIHEQTTKPD
jgi:cell division protein FtsI (penicillin-binding protein 3)